MELPTRTLPDNYIAIIKVLPCLYVQSPSLPLRVFSLRQASTAHVTPGKHTLEALLSGGLQSNTTKAGQCRELVTGDTNPYRCPWVIFTILKLCSLGKEGACKTCKSGALRQNILPGLKKNRRLKVDLRLSIVVLFNKFIFKEKKKNDLEKEGTLAIGLCT